LGISFALTVSGLDTGSRRRKAQEKRLRDVAEDSICGMRLGGIVAPGITGLLFLFSTLLK
jgi:hypothetical protein